MITETKTKKSRDEKTIKRQILTNAKKYLAELANQRVTPDKAYVAPSQEDLAAECKKRWQAHLDRKNKGKEDLSAYFD